MNVIIAYLETMFGAYPATPRMLEARAELQAMMEDAYADAVAAGLSENEAVGKVITEFGNLDELAPVLGITREIHPALPAQQGSSAPFDAATAGTQTYARPEGGATLPAGAPTEPAHPPITMEEATGYAAARQHIRYRVALAVALFVVSPSLIIALPVLSAQRTLPISQGAASLIGIFALFACVAAGVLTLVRTSASLSAFARVTEGRFTPDPAVSVWATEFARPYESARLRGLQFGVLLFILSPTPLIALSLGLAESPAQATWVSLGVVMLLFIVAAGILCILPSSSAKQTAEALTGIAADRNSGDEEPSIIGVIAAFYWPLLVLIYLAWSFIGDAWGHSWIVWPIGALLFGVISAGGGALESYRASKR
ncbi:MAG: hypothetical protein KA158_07560 [Leucobacter sp.]|nr:hypothetical protein [Leucobacter sp.]